MTSRCLHLLERCKNINQLRISHALIITAGLGTNSFALSRILAFCSDPSHNSLDYGYKVFKRILNPTICICNTMIKAFSLKDENFTAVDVYRLMLRQSMSPDNYTLPYVLKACANMKDLNLGKLVHGHGVKLGLVRDNYVGNRLIVMYSGFDDMEAARCIFDEILCPCVVSWTVLIHGYNKKGEVHNARLVFDEAPVKDRGLWGALLSGYVQNNCFKEGLKLFRLMQLSGIQPDEASLVSALSACAHLGSLEIGKWFHRYIKTMKMVVSSKLGTALIDMYAKCGYLDLAEKVFDEMHHKDVICWNTMISGHTMNGNAETALNLFHEMQKHGVRPDSVTFISLFAACSYSNMAQEGLSLLNVMCNVHNIEPVGEHYACIIDLLSRAKLIEEAYNIIQMRPVSGSNSEESKALRALLNACCSHGDISLAETVAQRLVTLERHSGAYVLLANAYAANERHEEAKRIRKLMKSRGVEKQPGCSMLEINGVVHEFVAGEKSHVHIDEVRDLLEVFTMQTNSLYCDLSFMST